MEDIILRFQFGNEMNNMYIFQNMFQMFAFFHLL